MNGQTGFDCHDFFDNSTLCILEISTIDSTTKQKCFEWLLIKKANLSVKKMELKTRDSSSDVQERYFDLGFLKYDGPNGIFIEAAAEDLHPLEHKGCKDIPQAYLLAISSYLAAKQTEQSY